MESIRWEFSRTYKFVSKGALVADITTESDVGDILISGSERYGDYETVELVHLTFQSRELPSRSVLRPLLGKVLCFPSGNLVSISS